MGDLHKSLHQMFLMAQVFLRRKSVKNIVDGNW